MTKNFAPTIGYSIWRLSAKVRTAVDVALSPIGLTHAQYVVLSSLWGMTRLGDRPTQRELAAHAVLDPIYISKLIRTLESAKLVTRTPDTKDTRAVLLAMTAKGEELAEQAMTIVHERMAELMSPLGGAGSPRSRQFAADLEALLAVSTNQ